ncbi:low temperature requirement protein A [Streptomyces zaomyceticus]|uniref:low temperature requirement protein A n=1 Tax=Streptomyces zaomyceticus TaxID=68286 RepID=UPI003F4E2079
MFFDLIAVAGVAQPAHRLHDTPGVDALGCYCLLCLAFWTAWMCFTTYGNVAADKVHTRTVLIGMFGPVVMDAAVPEIRSDHARAFALAYVLVRLLASRVWQRRGEVVVVWPIAQLSVGVVPWIMSVCAEAPARYWLWPAGLAADLALTFARSRDQILARAREEWEERAAGHARPTRPMPVAARFDAGRPYVWKGVDDGMGKVDSATRFLQKYKDVLHSVSPLNEPDNKRGPHADSPFMTDPRVPGATHDAKVEWLWTENVRRIRALDPQCGSGGPTTCTATPGRPPTGGQDAELPGQRQEQRHPPGRHRPARPRPPPRRRPRDTHPLLPAPRTRTRHLPAAGDDRGVRPGRRRVRRRTWNRGQELGRVRPLRRGLRRHGHLHQPRTAREHPAAHLRGPEAQRGWYFANWYRQLQGTRLDVRRWDARHS